MTELDDLLINIKNYSYKTWGEKYPDHKVSLKELPTHHSWNDFFKKKYNKPYFKKIESNLSYCLKKTDGKIKIYPYPDLVFKAFNITPLDKVKVVLLGQDPYFKSILYNNKLIPQAMGLSFSVPYGIPIPSSLNNIYRNLVKYNHIINMPMHGDLEFWAYQGCLMLNTSLTVQHGHKNSHVKYWTPFTDKLIKYISNNCKNIIFVLWGAQALDKIKFINCKNHKVIISSHPSGLSYNKPLRHYSPFIDQDHFGIINKYLKKHGKQEIIWQV